MKRILLGLAAFLAVMIILPALYLGVTLWRAHGGLPEWNGDVAVAGLDGPVEILRDTNGVAYIKASTRRDAMFAQGFVHAQDRFWQMSLTRQTMAGRLAEWMGRPALDSDRYMRHFAGEDMARRLLDQFPEEERPLLEAYAAGVNAWLDSPAYRRPPEMVILHIHPEHWRPDDSNARSYLPASENPRMINPASGRIVTANQRIIGDEYPHYLTDWYAPPDRALNGEHPEWCNNINTTDRIETCAELLTSSLTEARQMLESTFGPDPAGWTWDQQEHLEPHLGFDGLPLLDRMFSRRLPRPGGLDTAFITHIWTGLAPDFSRSFTNSSLQMILDLSDLDASLFMISGGQSGHFRSPHYHDLTPAWTRGERFTIPSDRDQIEIAAELHLRPQP